MPRSQAPSIGVYQLGLKLRTLRTGKQLTLSRLAAETGLSTALLSKLETDRMTPTLPTLSKISTVYGVSLSYFFSDPRRHSVSITRKGNLTAIRGSQEGVRRIPLSYDHIGSLRCGASMLEFSPGALVAASEPGLAVTCFLHVLEGRLDLNIGGDKDALEAGDCACLDTEMMVVWGSGTKEPCRVLLVKVGSAENSC